MGMKLRESMNSILNIQREQHHSGVSIVERNTHRNLENYKPLQNSSHVLL